VPHCAARTAVPVGAAMSSPLCVWPGRDAPNGLVTVPLTGVAIRPLPQPAPGELTGVLTGTETAGAGEEGAEGADGVLARRCGRGADVGTVRSDGPAPIVRLRPEDRSADPPEAPPDDPPDDPPEEPLDDPPEAPPDDPPVEPLDDPPEDRAGASGAAASGRDTVTTWRPPPDTNEIREWKRAAHVRASTSPVARSPQRSWKRITAARVIGPKIPSASTPT
jgi:hypothetical protein